MSENPLLQPDYTHPLPGHIPNDTFLYCDVWLTSAGPSTMAVPYTMVSFWIVLLTLHTWALLQTLGYMFQLFHPSYIFGEFFTLIRVCGLDVPDVMTHHTHPGIDPVHPTDLTHL